MTNPTPPGQVPDAIDVLRAHAENKALRAQQDDAYDHGPQAETVEEAARDVGKWLNERPNRPLDLRHVAMLTHHAKRTAHVQNPAEIEHVAGDVVKNGAELNTSTQQPAPAGAEEPFCWRWENIFNGGTGAVKKNPETLGINMSHPDYKWTAPYTAPQPAPAGATPAEAVERIVHLRAYRERRIYVAGPMTGLPGYNFPLFNSTAERLRSEGWHVENPAEHGHVEGAGWADYLRWDISRIATCGAIYLLPGWSNSKGATLEVHIAGVLALEVLLADGAEAPTPQPSPAAQAASSTVLKAIREANMQLVRTGDDAFMLVPYKVATAHAAESVPEVSDLPPLPDPDLRDVGTKPQDVKDFLNGYATEYARLALAARAPAESVPAPVLDSLLNIVINHEARATPAEVRSMAAELATYRAARAPAESVGRDAPEAALSPQVHLTRNTLLWWSELASINPQDLVPRIDAVLAANGVNK